MRMTGIVLEVERAAFSAAVDGDDTGFDAGSGAELALVVAVGFLDDAAPVFIDAP